MISNSVTHLRYLVAVSGWYHNQILVTLLHIYQKRRGGHQKRRGRHQKRRGGTKNAAGGARNTVGGARITAGGTDVGTPSAAPMVAAIGASIVCYFSGYFKMF